MKDIERSAQVLKDALEKYESDGYYGKNYQNADPVIAAARAYLYAAESKQPQNEAQLRVLLGWGVPKGWELEAEIEGGQPNGIGEIEPNDSRDWFDPHWETHHRTVFTITGPWEDGPTPEEAEYRQRQAEAASALAAKLAAEKEANRPSEEDAILRKAEEILARRKAESGE